MQKEDSQFEWGEWEDNSQNNTPSQSNTPEDGEQLDIQWDDNSYTIPLNIKDKDGRFDFSPTANSELGKLIECVLKTSMDEHNLKIIDCNVIKCNPNESFLNIFSGKFPFNFLYVAQSNDDVGEIVLDFSAMGGPSFNTRKYEEGSLILIPGWVPYRISKNNSQQDHILIAGMLG